MGHFVSIRGWLEIDEQMESDVKEMIDLALDSAISYGITSREAELYLQGWIIPERYINWTKYIFYGADIRMQGLTFLKEHFRRIAEDVWLLDGEFRDYVTGLFSVDDEDGTISLFWKLEAGKLIEVNQDQV